MHSNLIKRISLFDKDFQTNDLIRQVLVICLNSYTPGAGHFWDASRGKAVLLMSSGHSSL